MKKIVLFIIGAGLMVCSCGNKEVLPSEITLSRDTLMDKIKGGWAGQAIGCTYGGPTEFRYCGEMIDESVEIEWPEHYLKSYFDNSPGLYDDIYMDLTFVDVFEKKGLDAPVEAFADAFANADYLLWHANQQARYNIQRGIMPPKSGYWENNPHADDIDFQIEADYAGLMSPGMPNAASRYADGIGHIMNYGDGWYGGVYVACMYALAFVCDDIGTVVAEALKSIPEQSRFHKCIRDVIGWHNTYPDDWKQTWKLIEEKWSDDIGCPDGVDKPFDIDALINSAYIVTGLLYGDGDFSRTMEIATRCGQDSDCNPASAGGILGTLFGYSHIPEVYMPNLREVEDMDFAYTSISLNDAYQLSFKHSLDVIERNGGKVSGDKVSIICQKPEAVRYEESFTGHTPEYVGRVDKPVTDAGELQFSGKGIVVSYGMNSNNDDYTATVEVYLDGNLDETVILPSRHQLRKQELYYKYNLQDRNHTLTFKLLNPVPDIPVTVTSYVVYVEK